jgi:hypothetical protein
METRAEKRGITFVPTNELSSEARTKLRKLIDHKKEKLEKLVVDFNESNWSTQKH